MPLKTIYLFIYGKIGNTIWPLEGRVYSKSYIFINDVPKSPTIQSQREREKREVLGSDRWSWWRGSEIAHHQESSDMASRVVPVPNQPRGFRLI